MTDLYTIKGILYFIAAGGISVSQAHLVYHVLHYHAGTIIMKTWCNIYEPRVGENESSVFAHLSVKSHRRIGFVVFFFC